MQFGCLASKDSMVKSSFDITRKRPYCGGHIVRTFWVPIVPQKWKFTFFQNKQKGMELQNLQFFI